MTDPKRIGSMLPGGLGRAAGLLSSRQQMIDEASGYSSGPRPSNKKKKRRKQPKKTTVLEDLVRLKKALFD